MKPQLKPQPKPQLKPLLLLLSLLFSAAYTQHPNAHAHNDYNHKNPLQDALAHGFTSVEADIFLIRGKLIVAHTRPILKKKHTLEELYLKPLKEISEKNAGPIHPGSTKPFTLMIDFKTDGQETYNTLLKELKPYEKWIYKSMSAEAFYNGPIKIVLSGSRPSPEQIDSENQWVWLDGRPKDLEHQNHTNKIAWISDRYSNHFTWKGEGTMPKSEQAHLEDFVEKAHQRNAEVRFWATPEKEAVWEVLLNAGVDRISTDNLEQLDEFLRNKRTP